MGIGFPPVTLTSCRVSHEDDALWADVAVQQMLVCLQKRIHLGWMLRLE